MGVPVAPAKQFTWIVKQRRLKREGQEPAPHPGNYFPSPEGQFMPNSTTEPTRGRGRGRFGNRGGGHIKQEQEKTYENLTWEQLKQQHSGPPVKTFNPFQSRTGGKLDDNQINRLGQRPQKVVHKRTNNMDEIGKELGDPNEGLKETAVSDNDENSTS